MSCSTCDDYQLVPGIDGLLIACPDCLGLPLPMAVRCPAHGCAVVNGRCGRCGREAEVAAEVLLDRAREAAYAAKFAREKAAS